MASTVDLHEGEVARRLDFAVLLAIGLEGRELGALEALVARPLKLVGPGLVAQPVADEIGITSVNKHRDLLKDARDEEVEGLHPVAVEEEVAVDIEVTAFVAADGLNAEGLHDILLIEVAVNVAQSRVAKTSSLAINANIIGVPTRLLIRAKNLVVAVDRGGNAAEKSLGLIAALDHGLAPGQGVVHRLALALRENSVIATLAARHGSVVGILGVRVGQAVANQDRLEVDVAVLVGKDLRGEDRNVVTSIRLASNVEILLGILRELLEEQRQQRVDILPGGVCVAHRAAAIRVTDVHGLVEEDDGSIAVPGAGVVLDLDLVGDGGWAKLEEEASQGRAAWATVEPEDDRVVLGVVARLEEP